MGSILRQSIQAPEKKSIKIKSFCFGISVKAGVTPAEGDMDATMEGLVEMADVCSGVQEDVRETIASKRNQNLEDALMLTIVYESLILQHPGR